MGRVIRHGDGARRARLDLSDACRTLNHRCAFPSGCFHSHNVERYISVALQHNNKVGHRRLKWGVIIWREPAIVRTRRTHESLAGNLTIAAGRAAVPIAVINCPRARYKDWGGYGRCARCDTEEVAIQIPRAGLLIALDDAMTTATPAGASRRRRVTAIAHDLAPHKPISRHDQMAEAGVRSELQRIIVGSRHGSGGH